MSVEHSTVRLWARAFTRELDLISTIEGFSELSRVLGEPSLVPVNFAELTTGGMVPRIALADPPQGWTIQITSESLDVEFRPTVQVADVEFQTFCEKAAGQLRRVLNAKEAKAHRVAVLWERLLLPLDPDAIDGVAGRMLHLPNLFGNSPFEWDWRAGVRVKRTFGDTEELTNTIGTIKRVEATVRGSKADRLLLITDVNTDHRKKAARFTGDEVQAFVKNSPAWHAELSSAVLSQAGVAP